MPTSRTFSSRFTRPVFLWAVAAALTEVLVTWLVVHKQVPRWLGLLVAWTFEPSKDSTARQEKVNEVRYVAFRNDVKAKSTPRQLCDCSLSATKLA